MKVSSFVCFISHFVMTSILFVRHPTYSHICLLSLCCFGNDLDMITISSSASVGFTFLTLPKMCICFMFCICFSFVLANLIF